jgi:hypothetical protein
MSIQIPLSPKSEALLRERAAERGMAPDQLAAKLVEDSLQSGQNRNGSHSVSGQNSDTEARLAAFDRWMASVPARPGPPVNDSRESIYED